MSDANRGEVERIFAAPFITDLGLQLESLSAGECRSSLVIRDKHLQQDGFVHAGVQATVADHTAGAAAASLAMPGQYVLTADFTVNLLRAARGTQLTCTAKVLKAGALLTVVESEVYCGSREQTRLVAKVTVTLAVVTARE